MPPIYRHIVPNVPDKADNGSLCYRGNAPSYQCEMKFVPTWHGDITTPYGTLSASEINDALPHFWEPYEPYFWYGWADTNWWDDEPGAVWYASVWIRGYGERNIRIFYDVGLVWSAQNNYWQWVMVVHGLGFDYDPSVLSSLAVARFASTPTSQMIRLGNGVQLPFSRMLIPADPTDPDVAWRNTACAGCSITLAAQYA